MPFQHRKPLAALETDQVICLYGLPDRDGRLAMRRRNRLPGLHQCLMDIVDKFREVRLGYGVVADMGADDLDCQRAHCFFGHIPVLRKHTLRNGNKTRHQQWLESCLWLDGSCSGIWWSAGSCISTLSKLVTGASRDAFMALRTACRTPRKRAARFRSA